MAMKIIEYKTQAVVDRNNIVNVQKPDGDRPLRWSNCIDSTWLFYGVDIWWTLLESKIHKPLKLV